VKFLRWRETLSDEGYPSAVFGQGDIEDDDGMAGAAGIDEKITGLNIAVEGIAVSVE